MRITHSTTLEEFLVHLRDRALAEKASPLVIDKFDRLIAGIEGFLEGEEEDCPCLIPPEGEK